MTTIEWGAWLDWDGRAEMPPGVNLDDPSQVWLSGEAGFDSDAVEESRLTQPAGAWCWVLVHSDRALDIIRYRLRADHPVYGKVETVRVDRGWFYYDPYGEGFQRVDTEQDARDAAREIMKYARDEVARDYEWDDYVDEICWGRIGGTAVKSEMGDGVDFRLADIPLPEAVTVQGGGVG